MKISNYIDNIECRELLDILTADLDLWVFVVSSKNKFIWANKEFLKVIGLSDVKKLANKDIDAVPFLKASQIDKKFKLCLAGEKKIIEETEVRIDNKKYSVKLKIFPFIYKKSSEKSALFTVMEDISRYSALSNKVKKTNWFMDNIFNNVRVYSIITTDNDFLIQRFNKGAELLFEYSANEVENKFNIAHFFSKGSSKNFQEIMAALKVLNLVRREVEMKNKMNVLIEVDLTISKIMDEHKSHIGYIFMASDITDHKKLKTSIEKQNMELVKLYQETQKANKAKSFFLANMSHEFRTPLTAILGFSELMLDGRTGALSNGHKEFINDIYSSGKHLLDLINDVLDLSKIEADHLELDIEGICLNDCINSAKTFILPEVRKKNIELIDKMPEKKIWVNADESRLKQALYNIYSNASKFTDDNGRITTEVKVSREMAEVSIIDTGIGIRPEDQEIIFEEFLQLENPYSKKYIGTGLGLALVKRFMELMGGGVTVFSEGEGKGSAFTITIPLKKLKRQ